MKALTVIRSTTFFMSIVLVLAIALLWLAPPVGFVAIAILFAILPPWGRSITERAVISGVVLLGIAAVVFPRASDLLPINHLSARIFFAAVLVGAFALRVIPKLRTVGYPRPQILDALIAIFVVLIAWIPINAFRSASIEGTISALFHNGWDNHGHFTMFSNTFTQQSTLWQTMDGSVAWNQWYPSLHGTFWSLTQYAISDATPGRLALLEPFAIWQAATFAVCLGAMAWISGDAARRIAQYFSLPRYATYVSAIGFMIFGFLGSVQLLLSAGFTNFFIAVTVVAAASYISGRSMRSARVLGWWLIPLAGISVISLWTPLVIALVPAGVVTAIALWRERKLLGVIWLLASGALGAYLVITQSQAVIGASDAESALDFNNDIGAVGIGMVPFNLALGLSAPFLGILLSILLVRVMPHTKTLMATLLLPATLAGLLAAVFMYGADASEVPRIASYYALKSLDASMLIVIPALASIAAVIVVSVLVKVTAPVRVLALVTVGVLAASSFGYVGTDPERLSVGFSAAPGVQVNAERNKWITDDLIGDVLINSALTQGQENDYTPILWDASGQLQNLWVASLTGVLSSEQTDFYGALPDFPYDNQTLDSLNFAVSIDGDLMLNVLWFRPVSGELIIPWVEGNTTGRVTQAQVPMVKSAVCEECPG